jgi:hypothetical protein
MSTPMVISLAAREGCVFGKPDYHASHQSAGQNMMTSLLTCAGAASGAASCAAAVYGGPSPAIARCVDDGTGRAIWETTGLSAACRKGKFGLGAALIESQAGRQASGGGGV